MISYIKKYSAILYGFLILYLMVRALIFIDFIRIDSEELVFNTLSFIFWGLIISLIIHAIISHKEQITFYWMLLIWTFSFLGFVLGKYFGFKVGAVIFIFIFLMANIFILWSWYIQKYRNLKATSLLNQQKTFLIKLVILSLHFAILFIVDNYMNVPDNPYTFLLVTLFWLGISYVVAPAFFNKYKFLILGIYGALLLFFFIFIFYYKERTHSENLDLFFVFLFPVPLFIILWIYDQWKWFQNLKADKTKAELALLKQQVNPHFFFNTLNNLYGLAKQKSERTPDLILKLSDIMRYVIYKGKENLVKLEEEIEYLQNYIEIQEIRQHKKLDIRFEKKVEKQDILIPPLLFIILLENAFKHGVDTLTDQAYVHIYLEVIKNRIIFKVANNYDASGLSELRGIGLENLKKRLEILYGSNYSLETQVENNVYSAGLQLEID